MRDDGYLVVWLLYMFYRYTVVLYTVTLFKESTFYTDEEVLKLFVSESCQCVFAASSKSSPEYVVQFFFFYQTELVNTGLGYKKKDAHRLFRCCTKC